MAGIDIAILSTHMENSEIANRPMSNNGDVTYNAHRIISVTNRPERCRISRKMPRLPWASEAGLFPYVAVEGTAELIRDKTAFQAHWTSDLDKWFDKAVDTPGIVLIKISPKRVTYWKGTTRARLRSELFQEPINRSVDFQTPNDRFYS